MNFSVFPVWHETVNLFLALDSKQLVGCLFCVLPVPAGWLVFTFMMHLLARVGCHCSFPPTASLYVFCWQGNNIPGHGPREARTGFCFFHFLQYPSRRSTTILVLWLSYVTLLFVEQKCQCLNFIDSIPGAHLVIYCCANYFFPSVAALI